MRSIRLFFIVAVVLGSLSSAAQLPWLHVEGNRIKDASGNNVTLRGVSILAPEHNNECTTCNTKPISEMLGWQADATRGWNSRVVRLQVTGAKVSDPAQSFAEIIDPYVQQAISKGLYIIVDLHLVSNYGPGGIPQTFVMNFWKYVAPRYAHTPNVLFEVFNEPINPDVWTTWKSYIQPVIDTIRAVAPDNLILIGGPQWSTRVNSAAANPITGSNLVYVYHIYPNQGAATSTILNSKFGTAAQTIPVMLTEFGWNTSANYTNNVTKGTTAAWGTPFRQYIDAHSEISWTSYIFDNYWKPQYFDWSWNLMGGDDQGQFMQQWFLDKKGQDQPQPASLTAYGVGARQVNLSWPLDTTASGYYVKRSFVSGGPYITVDSGVTTMNFSDTGLNASTTYYYVVSAVHAGVEGPHSSEVQATTESAGSPPDVPMILTATAGDRRVTLGWWQASVGASSYNVRRSDAPGGPFVLIASGLTGFGYTDSNLVNGHTYYYAVSSVGVKESALSAVVRDIPSSIAVFVDNVNAVTTGTWSGSVSSPGYYGSNYMHDGNTGAAGGKSARFTPNLPVAGSYDVSMRWTSGINRSSNTPVDVNYSGGASTFVINQQRDNGVWKYLGTFNFDAGTAGNVLIRNDSTNGYVIADGVRFVINPGDVSASSAVPDSLTATAVSCTQIALQWVDHCNNELGFFIDRALDSLFTVGLVTDTVGANVTQYQDTTLSPSTTYYYRVRAFNNNAVSAWSVADSATTAAADYAYLKKLIAGVKLLKIYPNPAVNSISIQSLPPACRSIAIYDVSGVRRVFVNPGQSSVVTIDISQLRPGFYIILALGDKLYTGVFLKQ